MKCYYLGLFLALCQPATAKQQPVTLDAMQWHGVWFVRGSIRSVPVILVLDTGALESYVEPGVIKRSEEDCDVMLGSLPLSKARLHSEQLRMFAVLKWQLGWEHQVRDVKVGVLGANVLGNLAIGFDRVTSKITVWPRGNVQPPDVEAWFGTKQTATVPLIKGAQGATLIDLQVSGKGFKLLLDSGAQSMSLVPKTADLLSADTVYVSASELANSTALEETRITRSFNSPPFSFTNLTFLRTAENRFDAFAARPSGVFSLNNFHSSKVLLDLAGSKAWWLQNDEDFAAGATLQHITGMPISLRGDKLTVGPLHTAFFKKLLGPYADNEVVSVAGTPSAKIIKAFRAPSDAGMKLIAQLMKGTRKVYLLEIQTADGILEMEVKKPSASSGAGGH